MPGRGGKAASRRVDIDFANIARELLGRADQLVPSWLPNGKREGHEWKVGNLRGDAGRSLSINLTTGAWGDFAAGEVGGDLLALYAAIHGVRMIDAARQLGYVRDDDRPRPRRDLSPSRSRRKLRQTVPTGSRFYRRPRTRRRRSRIWCEAGPSGSGTTSTETGGFSAASSGSSPRVATRRCCQRSTRATPAPGTASGGGWRSRPRGRSTD